MLRVLGRTTSINVRKVLWTADEVGVPFVQEDAWATPAAPVTSPQFRKLNPNALVPVIEDDNGVLWESNTICRYLVQRAGRADLLPQEAAARARVEMWMDWQATQLNNAWRYAFHALIRKNPVYNDPEAIAKGLAAWTAAMHILEDQLAKTGAYASGPDFTLADVGLGLSAHRYLSTPQDLPDLPAVEAYMARLAERPAFRLYATAQLA